MRGEAELVAAALAWASAELARTTSEAEAHKAIHGTRRQFDDAKQAWLDATEAERMMRATLLEIAQEVKHAAR